MCVFYEIYCIHGGPSEAGDCSYPLPMAQRGIHRPKFFLPIVPTNVQLRPFWWRFFKVPSLNGRIMLWPCPSVRPSTRLFVGNITEKRMIRSSRNFQYTSDMTEGTIWNLLWVFRISMAFSYFLKGWDLGLLTISWNTFDRIFTKFLDTSDMAKGTIWIILGNFTSIVVVILFPTDIQCTYLN